jgi:hypothetical protein
VQLKSSTQNTVQTLTTYEQALTTYEQALTTCKRSQPELATQTEAEAETTKNHLGQNQKEVEVEDQEPEVEDQDQDQKTQVMKDREPKSKYSRGDDGGWTPRRLIKEIRMEKAKRNHELQLLDHRKRILERKEEKLSHEQQQLARARSELDVRENQVLQTEHLIPIARQLQQMGIGLGEAITWIETIHEKAQFENIPVEEAAYGLAQDLRLYRQLGGLQVACKQLVSILGTFTTNQQQAIAILTNLKSRGISETDIIQLISNVRQQQQPQQLGTNGNGWLQKFLFKQSTSTTKLTN